MTDTHDIFAEKQLGKSADLGLIRRIYPFVSPYRILVAVSLLLIVGITLLELAIPYVTKVAIDRYIVPEESAAQPLAADGKTPSRFLRFDLDDPAVREAVRDYPELFEADPPEARISYENLRKIPDERIRQLRQEDIRGVFHAALLLLGIVLLNFLITFAQVMLMEYTAQKIMHDLRMRLFSHIQKLSIHFFNHNPVGRLVTRVTNDIQNMHEMLTSVVIFVMKDVFMIVGITVVLIVINWKLALVVYSVFPFVFYAAFRFAGNAREAYRTLRIKIAEINTKFAETIGGIHILQLFNQESNSYKAFRRLNHENFLADMRQVTVFAMFMPFIEMMSSVALAIVIFYGGGRILAGHLSLGELVIFISYIRMFFRPIRDIAEKYNITQNALSSAERIFLILAEDDRLPVPARPEPVPDTIRELAAEDVWFSYQPGNPVLKGVTFRVSAGQTLAIVGPTGAGKTSLINLLIRFFDPDSGMITINGTDFRKFEPSALRTKMALVTQDPFLFSGSIRNNIFAGNGHPQQSRIDDILSRAQCADMIARLPDGIDTELNEQGSTLSSGQRQLLSIARALAQDPEFIIFDEATSYVDSETEARVQEALSNLMAERTSLVIAHRLSTARMADTILVMRNGKIIESGSHQELMQAGGFYYRLVQIQN